MASSRSSAARTGALVGFTVSGVLLLTGCAAGFTATTTKPYPPADGVMGRSGDIRVSNALVVAPEGGTDGVVSMTISNENETRPDEITALESTSGTVDLTGPRTIPAGKAVAFGAGSNPSATIQGLTVEPGDDIDLKLTFARTDPITLHTVVVPASGYYASVTPPAQPSPTPTTTAGSPTTTSASPTSTTSP